jgi:nicotinamidase-related amidase
MIHPGESNVVTLVSALDEAGMFVVFAARIHRTNRQGSVRQRQCLCQVFHAAGLCGSHALFIELQDVLSADNDGGFQPAERGTRVINRQEAFLLGALAHWQRHPGDLSDHALELLVRPAVRRMAAPLAREFARCMTRAGLRLHFQLSSMGSTLHSSPGSAVSVLTH